MISRVMIVDDERIIAETLRVILNGCGYEARAFYDGESALRACMDWTPEFVLSDVVMPGMGGVEMAIRISGQYPSCTIVLFSGQAGAYDLLEEARIQGYDFELLMKPVHPKDVLAILSQGGGRSRQAGLRTPGIGLKARGPHVSVS